MNLKNSVFLITGIIVVLFCLKSDARSSFPGQRIPPQTHSIIPVHPNGLTATHKIGLPGYYTAHDYPILGFIPIKRITNSRFPARTILLTLLIGAIVGFLSGMLGKGGSAITTPALQIFVGITPLSALASPLPATLPTTISASMAYKSKKLINRYVIRISVLLGIPATIIGSFFSDWVGGKMLMVLTALFVLILGISFFIPRKPLIQDRPIERPPFWKISVVALLVGTLSGLLANSGGILFGPLFIRFLKLPTKQAFACSLIVSACLAIPGTLAHWYLGHIDWYLVLYLSIGSIPFSYLGARFALTLTNDLLERIFGIMLVLFGSYDLYFSLIH
ncbi:MAG TPA: sulfite exporter TauE/SafE family protein [Chitinophagaceae bacterium]|nr:sulfite exporter TauE/SafE family protein [Chitinophagaceae bacterium]